MDKYSMKESENIESIGTQSTGCVITETVEDIDMREFRDTLAQRMWADYMHHIA